MKSTKCVTCGFVGWAEAENCKACGAPLGQHSHNLPLPPSPPAVNYASWDEPQKPKQGLAIAGLVLGIISFTSCGLLSASAIPGTILSWKAMKRAKREPHVYGGYGMATAGFVLNLTFLVVFLPIVFAIAIPNLLASRRAANEGAAMASMRRISEAESVYQNIYGKFGTLNELAAQNLVDEKLASGTRSGYSFRLELTTDVENQEGYAVTAIPVTYGSTGARSFYIDETQVLRAADNRGGPASKMDPAYDYDSDRDSRPRRADYRPQTVY